MSTENNRSKLIQNMQPFLNPGKYVFTSVKNSKSIPRSEIVCEFKEDEGITLIVKREIADQFNMSYNAVFSWITLNIQSSLEAVGFTAAFSSELTKYGISCNVIAGFHHDHIFVNKKDAQQAMEVLTTLSKNHI